MKTKLKYKRILLKLSGEVLKGDQESGIDGPVLMKLAKEVKQIQDLGCEVGANLRTVDRPALYAR